VHRSATWEKVISVYRCTCPCAAYRCTCPYVAYRCTCPCAAYRGTCPYVAYRCTCSCAAYRCTCPCAAYRCTCPCAAYRCTCPYAAYRGTCFCHTFLDSASDKRPQLEFGVEAVVMQLKWFQLHSNCYWDKPLSSLHTPSTALPPIPEICLYDMGVFLSQAWQGQGPATIARH